MLFYLKGFAKDLTFAHGELITVRPFSQTDNWESRDRYLGTVKRNIRDLQWLVRETWSLISKMCKDLNGNKFLFRCQVHYNIWNQQVSSGMPFWWRKLAEVLFTIFSLTYFQLLLSHWTRLLPECPVPAWSNLLMREPFILLVLSPSLLLYSILLWLEVT